MENVKVGPILLGVAVTGATGLCLYLLMKDKYLLEESKAVQATRRKPIILTVNPDDVDLVLGRQGSNLLEIQSRTNTTITLHQESFEGSARFEILGSPDNAVLAEILIQQTINSQPRLEKSQMTIPKEAVSTILGRREEKKRSIELASRCKITVEKVEEETVLHLSGTKGQIEEARKILEEGLVQLNAINTSLSNKGSGVGRLAYDQPLFLKYEAETEDEATSSLPTLQQAKLCSSGSDQLIQVYVSCVASPSQFWVQNVGPSSIQLDKLTQSMTEYYSVPENQMFHALGLNDVRKGDIVVTSYAGDDNFYRAKVVEIKVDEYDSEQSVLDLDFIDYGDCQIKPIKEVFEIKSEFLKLHFQAIKCKLADIRCVENEWSEESIVMFEKASHCATWKNVLAKIIQTKANVDKGRSEQEDEVMAVQLFVTSELGEKSIGEELVRQGLARFNRS